VSKTRLDRMLDTVVARKSELTLDVSELTAAERARVKDVAEARGLHVSGTNHWFLIRDLRVSGLDGLGSPADVKHFSIKHGSSGRYYIYLDSSEWAKVAGHPGVKALMRARFESFDEAHDAGQLQFRNATSSSY